jgi:hypothetical protein
MFEAAVMNWEVRTKKHTAESLCDYINSKREAGMTDHYAFTEEQFKQSLITANHDKTHKASNKKDHITTDHPVN